MVTLSFTANIQRHVECEPRTLTGKTVAEVLAQYFEGNEEAKGYVLDDQGALRHHMMIFVDGAPIADRAGLTDPIGDRSEIYVMQALSGG